MNFRAIPSRLLPLGTMSIKRTFQFSVVHDNILDLLELFIDPLVVVLTLWVLAVSFEGELRPSYQILSLIVFVMTFPGLSRLQDGIVRLALRIVGGWLGLATLLLLFGYASHYIDEFDSTVIKNWLWIAPTSQIIVHLALRVFAPFLMTLQGATKKVVIAGVNTRGIAIASRIAANRYSDMEVMGFFDDRDPNRLLEHKGYNLLGNMSDLPGYVKTQRVDKIYLSLSMETQPRILNLLDQLRDTTASIYFVPNIFITDLIQGRMGAVGDMPVVAVCETPFSGTDGIIKRVSDIVLSLIILTLIFPLLLLIAIGVKLSSPGPVLFKQRRYGLDGEEISVFKFRSMTVQEDGNQIQQARQNDIRTTKFGAFLRKTSLDELPQFFNVLQGRMSIVGPRPHAVAHNEMYRKLIKGYMVRHKVKPGITGWAQVNGLRGETDTLDKMEARVEFDLDYLRNWSLSIDIYIIFRTIAVVFSDRNAY